MDIQVEIDNVKRFDVDISDYHQSLIGVAYRILSDLERAKDGVQDVYLKVYQSPGSFQGRSSFKTYLYRMVINRCLDIHRQKKRWLTLIEMFSYKTYEQYTHDKVYDNTDLIRRLFQNIPDSIRIPLVLAEMDGMTYQEISEIMELPVNTVKTRIFRCREKLRKELTKQGLLL